MSKANFDDVRETALDAINKLKDGQMDVKTAQAIKGLLDTIIDTGNPIILTCPFCGGDFAHRMLQYKCPYCGYEYDIDEMTLRQLYF